MSEKTYTQRGFIVYTDAGRQVDPKTNLPFYLSMVQGSHACPPCYPIRIYGGEPEYELSQEEKLGLDVPLGMTIGQHVCLSPVQARLVRDALTEYLNDPNTCEWDWDYECEYDDDEEEQWPKS